MIIKSLLICTIAISSSFSLGLDDIVNETLKNSYDLQILDKNIQIADVDIQLSKQWKNPTISIGANDIHFDEPFQRDEEAMQANYVAISQTIPINGKLDYQNDMAIQDKNIAKMILEDKKLQLASFIYNYGYNLLINKKKLELLDKYEKNTKELHDVALILYESGKVEQLIPLKAKLLISKIQLQKENIAYKIKELTLKLEKITYQDSIDVVEDIELNKIHKMQDSINTHPVIKMIEYKNIKFSKLSLLEEAKKFSDIKVTLGYFQRDRKYKDYVNLSFSMPLPIYGNEESNIAKARYKIAQTNDELQISKTKFEKDFKSLQEEMTKSFKNYKNLSATMLPQREFIQKNIQAHYGLGHMKSIDLLSNMNESISLEMLALDELAKYYSAFSRAKYYMGIQQ